MCSTNANIDVCGLRRLASYSAADALVVEELNQEQYSVLTRSY
jgi:hypothetical protein